MALLGFDTEHCVHNGPIIRREAPYEHLDIKERRKIFNKMVAFTRQLEFRKVIPSDYRLFQVADLICTLELMRLKMESKTISKHELAFWGKESDFRKNYLKRLYQKEYVTKNS